MSTYFLMSTTRGVFVRNSAGELRSVQAKSERAAKLAFTKMMYFVDWRFHIVIEN